VPSAPRIVDGSLILKKQATTATIWRPCHDGLHLWCAHWAL
jgi:hypothetical protein